MKCVLRTSDRTRAHLLRSALESEQVPAIVEGEDLASLQGELPVGASAEYRVSILDDDQLPRAALLARQWLGGQGDSGSASDWTCRVCGERHEPHFRSCWNCGSGAEPD
jgi:hypothetical protein